MKGRPRWRRDRRRALRQVVSTDTAIAREPFADGAAQNGRAASAARPRLVMRHSPSSLGGLAAALDPFYSRSRGVMIAPWAPARSPRAANTRAADGDLMRACVYMSVCRGRGVTVSPVWSQVIHMSFFKSKHIPIRISYKRVRYAARIDVSGSFSQ